MEEEEEDVSAGTSGPSPAPYNRELLSCGTVLQISDLPDDGFSDQDIKKIVQPFGKVSDLLVIRSRNEAFLEMNYKEAVIAAVKYAETVPVLVNGKQVKISVAEKPKPPPGQAKMSIKKRAPSIKKVAPSTSRKDKTTSKTIKPATSKKEKTRKSSATGDSKSKKTSNTAEQTQPELFAPLAALAGVVDQNLQVKTFSSQQKLKRKLRQTQRTLPEGTELRSLRRQERLRPKEWPVLHLPQELEDVCVVLISNLADKGYSVEEISNLARPFGGLRDVLILSSHKKAYLEMNRKSADSMVKFYTCFPRFLDGNQLCINMVPQFKTIKDEEAIFTAIIKKSDAKVNAETIHNQFVHLGNLPDDGYRELEVVCVGLRFGQVDNYVVLKNRNKAILQLDSSQSARSMYSFLKQYPYNMGKHTLTCSLSPSGEPPEAEVVKTEVKMEEPSGGSVAKKGPVPVSHGKDKTAAVQIEPSGSLERAGRDSVPRPAETSLEKEDAGVEAPVASVKSADTEPSEGRSEEMPLPSFSVEKGEAVYIKAELLDSAVASAPEKEMGDEELSAPAAEPPGLRDAVKAEDVLPGCAVKLAAEESTGAVPEVLPPASDAASADVGPAVGAQANRLDSPGKNPVAVQTKHGMPVTPSPGKSPVVKTGLATKKQPDVARANKAVKPEQPVLRVGRAVKENPEKRLVKTGMEREKKPAKRVARVAAAVESAAGAVGESSKGKLIKAHPNKGPRPARTGGTCRVVTLNPSLSVKKSSSVGKMILKAVVSLPDISKSRIPIWRNKPSVCKGGEQKAPLKPESQGQALAAAKNAALEEEDRPRPGGSRTMPGHRSRKGAVSRSAVVGGKGGNGRNSSLQEKDSRVETRASSKQSQEGENRPSAKKDNSSNKTSWSSEGDQLRLDAVSATQACVGGNARPLKRGTSGSAKRKEDEELFLFNLDEFVTVDEVVEDIESPVKKRRNPLKRKKKVAKNPLEPNPKRKKRKGSAARVAGSKQSFVTLDEIGEEEDAAAHDPQSLVVVDEVMEEEELMSEAVKDPRALVTLDELCEQEELGAQKGVPRSGFEEQGLKAEPLVTVDEIGEVEELPLNEPTELNMEEVLKHREGEKVAAEDAGDGASSQVPDDPSALVTVDEIQEDNEENPLMTLDEVNEEDDDFLADFNRLKEELNFVTVDEIGEEDEEEERSGGIPREKTSAEAEENGCAGCVKDTECSK
ncbi:PREDICTED: zinc finger protein 638, partial [Eurypyga helias]|uniref:zinc finger protein 638 n=1 Tax=Eurypyga helias TaxID=54383 RepID=UPI0005291D4A